ncbi:MAG: leucine-rich repeat domain-containing protein [Candidatus Cryptobacteroides sp.]
MVGIDRILCISAIAAIAFACTSTSDLPPEDATPDFAEVGYDAGTADGAGYAVLYAKLTTVNGVTLSGFMFGQDEVHLKFLSAEPDADCRFTIRVDNLENGADYCFYARAGNGRNEIRTRLMRFTTDIIPSVPDTPSDPGGTGPEPSDPVEPVMPPEGVGITVSDPVLMEFLLELYDADSDGKLIAEEAAKIEEITVNTDGIRTMDGVQYLSKLSFLDCCGSVWKGQLTSLALASNSSLKTLRCNYNHISAISLPSGLTSLECRFNKFGELNLSSVPHLKVLDCFGNGLESLDLSALPELESLDAGLNSFKTLDVSHNLLLRHLDLSDSPDLETLYVARGQRIEDLVVDNSVNIKYKE